MSDPIAEYQQWKKQGGELRSRAKHAMESRFREVLSEAVRLAEEYRADFGMALPLPAPVTAFKYKAGGKKAAKKPAPAPVPAPVPVKPASTGRPKPVPARVDPNISALNRQLESARRKLEAAQSKGMPTKNLEDRIYELEDDLRLAASAG